MRIEYRAVLYGCVVYAGLYLILFAFTNLLGDLFQNYWVRVASSPYLTLMYPVAGYFAGMRAMDGGILHGALVGVVVSLVTVGISVTLFGESWYGESIVGATISYLSSSVIMSGLGGGVGELHARRGLQA